MASTLDRALIVKKEATYGTYTPPDRAVEFLDGDTQFNLKPTIVQGQGIRSGALLPEGSRRVVVKQDVPAGLGFECLPKGQGALWELLMGAGVSTVVTAPVYQQVFTLAVAKPSFVAQEQWYRIGGDTSDTFTQAVYSYLGCVFSDWELTMGPELATVKANINGRQLDSAQSAVAVTLPSTAVAPFHRGNLTLSTGTLTLATNTALATATTPLGGVEQIVVKVNNNLNTDRPGAAGLKGKPIAQMHDLEVTATVEHRDNTWELAYAAQTAIQILGDYSGATLPTDKERLQVALADLRIDDLTKKVENGIPKLDLTMKGMQATTPMQVVLRTTDTAL